MLRDELQSQMDVPLFTTAWLNRTDPRAGDGRDTDGIKWAQPGRWR